MATGLFQAIGKYRIKQVKFLIESGLSANVRNAAGQTPLVAALHVDEDAKRERLFTFLVRHGADCSAYDVSTGRDIFTWCCFLDRTLQAQFVLQDQHGNLDFQQKDLCGRTALHYASANGNAAIVEALVEYMKNYHISVDVRDNDGFTPYILAQRLGHARCVALLAKAGASPEQFDNKNLKSATDWAWIGEREKSFDNHVMHTKRVGMYRLLGRLPQLKRANVKLNNTRPTHDFLGRKKFETHHEAKSLKSSQLFKETSWMDFNKTQQKHLQSRSLPNFHLSPIQENETEKQESQQLEARPKQPESGAAAETSSLYSTSTASLWTTLPGEFAEATSVNSSTSEERLFDIMRLVEQQYTHAYRPYVPRKPKTTGKAAKLPAIDGKNEKQRRVATKMETLAVAKRSKGKQPSAVNN